MENNHNMLHRLKFENKDITIIGTAHVSKQSADLVKEVIESEKPDTVCVELCEARFHSIMQKEEWRNTNIVKVIKEKKSFLLLSNLILASFQKRIAKKLDVKPGQEMLQAIESAEKIGARIHLADRNFQVTFSRIWYSMGFFSKIKLLFQLMMSIGQTEDISEEEIERMKEQDVLEALINEVSKAHPSIRKALIDERDQYLAEKIRTAPGEKIIAVVGAAHVPGIKKNWDRTIDIDSLTTVPPPKKYIQLLKWIVPLGVIGLLIYGFLLGGKEVGTDMVRWWIIANGSLAGIGALLALGHPFTILSSIIAAPITSLHPMIAAGWVSGLVEAFSRKPKVRDFENLPNDILSVRGFWQNKITRILLVVVFTNLGSSIGTFVALPMMMKVF